MNPYEEPRTDELAFMLLAAPRQRLVLPAYDFLVRGVKFNFRSSGESIEFDLLGVGLDARGAVDSVDVFEVKVEGMRELRQQIEKRIDARVFRRVWAAFVVNKGNLDGLGCGVLHLPGRKRDIIRKARILRDAPLLEVGDTHRWARQLRDTLPKLAHVRRLVGKPCVFLRCPACNKEVSHYYAFTCSMAVKYPTIQGDNWLQDKGEHAFFCPTKRRPGQRFFGGGTYYWTFVDGRWTESEIGHSVSGVLP